MKIISRDPRDLHIRILSRARPLVRVYIFVKIVLTELDKLMKIRLKIKYILECEPLVAHGIKSK